MLVQKGTEKETLLKIYLSDKKQEKHSVQPGAISTDKNTFLKVAATDGWIEIMELQLQGKKRMKVVDFLRGFQNSDQYSAT